MTLAAWVTIAFAWSSPVPMEEVKVLACDDMDKGFAVECDGIRWE